MSVASLADSVQVRKGIEQDCSGVEGAKFSCRDTAYQYEHRQVITDTLHKLLGVKFPELNLQSCGTYNFERLENAPLIVRSISNTIRSGGEIGRLILSTNPSENGVFVIKPEIGDGYASIRKLAETSSNTTYLTNVSKMLTAFLGFSEKNPLGRLGTVEFGLERRQFKGLVPQAKNLLKTTNQLLNSEQNMDQQPYHLTHYPDIKEVTNFIQALQAFQLAYGEISVAVTDKLELYRLELNELNQAEHALDDRAEQRSLSNRFNRLLATAIGENSMALQGFNKRMDQQAPQVTVVNLLEALYRYEYTARTAEENPQFEAISEAIQPDRHLTSINLRLIATDPEMIFKGLEAVLRNPSNFTTFRSMSNFELQAFAEDILVKYLDVPKDVMLLFRKFNEVAMFSSSPTAQRQGEYELGELATKVRELYLSVDQLFEKVAKIELVARYLQDSQIERFHDYCSSVIDTSYQGRNQKIEKLTSYFQRIGASQTFIDGLKDRTSDHLPEVNKLRSFFHTSLQVVQGLHPEATNENVLYLTKAIFSRRPDILLTHHDHFNRHTLSIVLGKINEQMTAGTIKITRAHDIARKVQAGHCDTILNNIEKIALLELDKFSL